MTHAAPPARSLLAIAVLFMAAAAALALLFLARAILVPVTLGLVLSFAAAPLVRMLRRLGLGNGASVFATVLSIATLLGWLAMLIGAHALRIAENFPAYRDTLEANVHDLRRTALSPMDKTWDAAEQLFDPHATGAQVVPPVLVEVPAPKPRPFDRFQRVLSWAWAPVGSTAIVIVVLIFALLERESLRDRFIRIAGRSQLRLTTTALDDAGQRLSRYLGRLFAVNIGVGIAFWGALSAIGLPSAALIATLAAVLRFIPFLGVPVAALFAVLLALSAAAGWTLALSTLLAFVTIELLVSHAVEPRVYGRATGLSPLAIVLATILWGGLWGPLGVLMATPLTLCLAVAGRHVESLAFLGVLLGDGPALMMAQKFYQRALSGDPAEILEGAHGFLARHPFAAYCDTVLVPALQIGRIDWASGEIDSGQYARVRRAIVHVLHALDGAQPNAVRSAAGGGLVLCLGMGLPADELAAELLVRILRGHGFDARHIKDRMDLHSLHVYGIAGPDIGAVCLVTMTAPEIAGHGVELANSVALLLPAAHAIGLLLPGRVDHPERMAVAACVDSVCLSFADAVRQLGNPISAR